MYVHILVAKQSIDKIPKSHDTHFKPKQKHYKIKFITERPGMQSHSIRRIDVQHFKKFIRQKLHFAKTCPLKLLAHIKTSIMRE